MKYAPCLLFCFSVAATTHAELLVNGGSLGLQTTVGATNHVWADPPSENVVFDRWEGDVSVLNDAYSWRTTAVMPAASLVISATYKAAPVWSSTTHILNGLATGDPNAVRLTFYFPLNPVGVIFLFHGGGGSASGWFAKNVENISFLRDAVAAGYAVAALDSTDRVNKQWDGSSSITNMDVVSVQSAITHFSGLGLMTADTPKFAIGMSNGGGFAPKPAYHLGFHACGIFCSSGQPAQIFSLTTVPTIWNLSRNDDLYDHMSFLPNATANLASLTAQSPSIAGELRENLASPVYSRRFLRVPGCTVAESQAIYNLLKSGGFLDPQDFLLADPATSGWASVLPVGLAPYQSDIADQLSCCYSAHKFFSDYNNKVLQFFGARRPPIVGRGPIRSIIRQTGGTILLTIAADPGQDYQVQASPDLATWTVVFTSIYSGGTFDFTDAPTPTASQRFYRTLSP